MLESGRRARGEIEAAILQRIGTRNLTAAKVALAALLDVAGLSERVASRTVPTPDE
jgi:hypothetical protein